MKIINKLLVIIPIIVLIFLSVYFVLEYYNVGKYDNFILVSKDLPNNKEEVYEEKITSLKKEYNNDDVVGSIQINDTNFNTVIMQGKDNSYYLNHLPDKTYNINGSIFLDYRIDIDESEKLLIFGHSSPNYMLPIMIIENYVNEDYYKAHQYVYISTTKKVRKYQIFSAYVETKDWDYMKINFSSAEEKEAHYQKLKNKSFYETGINVSVNDNLLIIQTCSNLKEYSKYKNKYMLVIAKEII